MALTPEAQAAIDEAIRIVREDRGERWWRERTDKWLSEHTPNVPPTPSNPTDPTVPPPPPKPTDPPPAPEPRKRSAYWGEVFEDDDK